MAVHADVDPEVLVFAREVARQHRRIQRLMRDVLDSANGHREPAWQELRRYLAVHEAAERLAMHPLFRARDRDDLSVLDRVAEEDDIALAMAALDSAVLEIAALDAATLDAATLDAATLEGATRATPGGAEAMADGWFAGAVAALCELVTEHLEREERDELAGFLHRITDDDAVELVEVLTLVEVAREALPGSGATFAELLELADSELDRLLGEPRGPDPAAR
ncbi:hypothetical protein [Phycicoccus ginsengisoli]